MSHHDLKPEINELNKAINRNTETSHQVAGEVRSLIKQVNLLAERVADLEAKVENRCRK